MDFDLSKENIQPLRRGRNVHQLEMGLHAQTSPEYQQELQQQKEHFENVIKHYHGDDPLQNYYEYITWIEQTFPKNGHEGNCVTLLEHCLAKFEDDTRYTNDIRFCKLWVKYNDMFPNPEELYLMMKSKNLCTGCAEFYKAWAYYYEASGDFQRANNIFEEGKRNLAQPYEDLELAHKNLITAVGEHMLYGPNESRLQEKRQALTSLHTYQSGRVNNVRVPSGSSNGLSSFTNLRREGSNAPLHIYEDQASAFSIGGAAPTSIITVAKRQEGPKENTLKPGPWTTVPHKKRVLGSNRPIAAGFTILEDASDSIRAFLPANLPPACLEDYSNWHVALQNYPDPPNANVLFAYPKHRVYSDPNVEYSMEELRALRYRKRMSAVDDLQGCEEMQPIIVVDDDEEDACIVVAQVDNSEQENVQMDATPNSMAGLASNQPCLVEAMSTVSHSPWKSDTEHQNFLHNVFGESNEHRLSSAFPAVKFDILEDPEPERPPFSFNVPEQQVRGFAVFEQNMQAPAQGNAMKTAFRTLNADEVETGSRGGMDGAMAAQPADDARPMPVPFSDSSSSSIGDDSYCCTQQFNFNLNAMQVSTPQSKAQAMTIPPQPNVQSSRKDLFKDKSLSTIIEEKSSCRSSSSGSSGTVTKLSLYSHKNKIGTISEEHNSYLEQNMKANEELRRSLLGNLMEEVMPVQAAAAPAPMQSSPCRKAVAPAAVQPLDYVPSDPFNANLIGNLLQRVSFPGAHSDCLVQIQGNPKLTIRKQPMYIGNERYVIEKLLGKGQFGTVFKGCNYDTNCTVALKYQKPPNKWEYYICKELQSRLSNHPLRDRFMDITIGYFSDQASVLVSQLEPLGSLLATANLLKSFFKGKESIAMYFTLQMLQIVKAMHEVKIIHADIKPDNFLVFAMPDNKLGLRLIDFGCSIDMTLFPDKATFTVPINTEDFICCEVRDGRPWSYHTDLFCVAATAHVILLQEYIQLKKSRDIWNMVIHLPRYLVQDLWNALFSSTLNQQSGPADVATLELLFQEEIDKPGRQKDLRIHLTSLSNMLKNR